MAVTFGSGGAGWQRLGSLNTRLCGLLYFLNSDRVFGSGRPAQPSHQWVGLEPAQVSADFSQPAQHGCRSQWILFFYPPRFTKKNLATSTRQSRVISILSKCSVKPRARWQGR
jgi:hypothetical protein